MPDNKNPSIENNNNIETPKKRSFFWWNLDLEKKDFLDFRYNTQEEIDKLNNEMMIEDLNSTITQSNNIENQINTKDDELVEESEIEGSADSSLENMQWGVQSPEEKINTEEELMEDDTDNISNKNNEEIVNAELEPESIDEESNLQVNDNQDLEYNEIFEWTDDENDWISSNKIFDPFELNFDDEDENDIENESIESNNENENNSENNDEDNNENYGETVDENSIEGNNEDETENNDEIKNDNENKIMDNNKDEIVDNDEDELSKGNDDVEGNSEDEIIDNNENHTESSDEGTIENNQDSENLNEIKNNDSIENNISEDSEDSNNEIVEDIEDRDIIGNHDEDSIDINDENESEDDDESEDDSKDKVVNNNEDEVVDDDAENDGEENNNEDEIIDNNEDNGIDNDGNDDIESDIQERIINEEYDEVEEDNNENNDIENNTENGILDEEDDKVEEDNTESDIIKNNEDNKISDDEDDNGIWVNTPFIPAGNEESNQTEKTNDTVRKKKRYSREWKQITKEEIELEEWQDIADNENDEEYIPSDEEIFEQEPEFFADDELSKQFMKLVWNARWIFKLERKNGEAESCFKIIGWKNTDTTIEYLFYLIEQPSEPLDLFIKKIERDLANWEEVEHLVQFSYADKKLNIFVDEVILYEDINNADDSSWEYRDTKAILEKFIFLTQTHYDELESEVKRQQEEKQKKRQLQNIFKGF